jgi:flagellar hook assembly protein FlgD
MVLAQNKVEVKSVQDFKVTDPAFAPQAGQQAAIIVDGTTYVWNGTNDNGQQVSSGIYYVKLEEHDSYGNVISYVQQVVVLAVGNQVKLRIYNSAGEEVKTLYSKAYGLQAPSHLNPDKNTLALGADGSDKIAFDLGGITAYWDGTNNSGNRVDSGTYTVKLEVQNLSGAQTVAATQVTVINAASVILGDPLIAPNPVPAAATSFQLRWKALPGIQVTARLYNVAGELIMTATNGLSPDRLVFDLGGRQVSGGIYLVAVTAKAPWGSVSRNTLKMVLVR